MGRKRDDRGQFVEEISVEDVIQVLRESDSPIETAKAVGDTLGCSAEVTRQKLLELRDRGVVARRQVGAGAVVWWLIADESTIEEASDFDGDDLLFTGDPLLAPDEPIDETEIDKILYA